MIWPYFHLLRIVVAFGGLAVLSRRRATHGAGVGARGTVRIVDDPQFPRHDFFVAGRTFPLTMRHANVQTDDDAGLDVRGAAVKFSDHEAESPFDLPMNTGNASIFNDLNNFWHLIRAEIFYTIFHSHRLIIRFYRRYPRGFAAEQGSVRRAPGSFSRLHYYSKLVMSFRGEDGVVRGVRYRLLPGEPGPEDGLPSAADREHPWELERLDGDQRPKNYLRLELKDRLARGPVVYRLQLQLHDLGADASVFDASELWDEQAHPWMDLATLTLDQALPDSQAERLRFSLVNQPDSLGTLPARSARDFNSVADLRRRAYGLIQKLRFFVPWSGRAAPAPCQALTVVTPVEPEALDALRALLARVRSGARGIRFERLANVHFLRWTLLEPSVGHDGTSYPPQLIYAAVFDGKAEEHVEDLVRLGGETLREIYAHCRGRPPEVSGPEALCAWLLAHRVGARAFFKGNPDHRVRRIHQDDGLYCRLQAFIDERRPFWKEGDAAGIRAELRDYVLSQPDLPRGAWPGPSPTERLSKFRTFLVRLTTLSLPFILSAALLRYFFAPGSSPWIAIPLLTLGLVLAFVVVWLLVVRAHELKDPIEDLPMDEEHLRRVVAYENFGVQNALTQVSEIRPGWFRQRTLRIVLWGANFLSRYFFTRGQLFGIGTIQFARFYILDGGRRMLFLSDYDGGWDVYLDEFLGGGRTAVIPIWANLWGFPPTRFLFWLQVEYAPLFKPFTRRRQTPVNVRYGAYDHLTVTNIRKQDAIRQGLFGRLTRKEEEEWLRLL